MAKRYEDFLGLKISGKSEKTNLFPSILNESHEVKSFINAVVSETLDDAKQYLSKRLMSEDTVDLDKLKRIMDGYDNFKLLNKANGSKILKNGICRNTVLIMGKNKSTLLHLYMIKEPDQFGNWKIYGIENERE